MNETWKDNLRKSRKKAWDEISEEERAIFREKVSAAMRAYWAKKSDEERKEIGKAMSKGRRGMKTNNAKA